MLPSADQERFVREIDGLGRMLAAVNRSQGPVGLWHQLQPVGRQARGLQVGFDFVAAMHIDGNRPVGQVAHAVDPVRPAGKQPDRRMLHQRRQGDHRLALMAVDDQR
ncbi:hypothetical protein SDC9_194821 [bioreactor metagenome]|uniref:Uncharacterized protein n=1 Tax=bioreactor metagenome TaxID=1076179 RepID=A0A645I7W5_9ZZZZ